MLRYPILLATEYMLQRFLQQGIEVEGKVVLKVSSLDKEILTIDLDKITSEESQEIFNLEKVYVEIERLCTRPVISKDLEYITAVYFLTKHIRDNLERSYFREDSLIFYYLGERFRLDVERVALELASCTKGTPNWQKYSVLVLVQALIEGYIFKEERGSHFLVASPYGTVQATTLFDCTCQNFITSRDCLHLRSVLTLANNRWLLGKMIN